MAPPLPFRGRLPALRLAAAGALVALSLVQACSQDSTAPAPQACGSTIFYGAYALTPDEAFGGAAVGVGFGVGWYDPGDTWSIDNPGPDVPIGSGNGDPSGSAPVQDPGSGDPGVTPDPGAGTDPGAGSDPGSGDPGTASVRPHSPSRREQGIGVPPTGGIKPPSAGAAAPTPTAPASGSDGCYHCAVACATGDAGSTSALAEQGLSAYSHDDACGNAVAALEHWVHTHASKPIARCRALSYVAVAGMNSPTTPTQPPAASGSPPASASAPPSASPAPSSPPASSSAPAASTPPASGAPPS